ncbi:MAG: type II toxin-antitoxin system PemK/MazF family toxin [Gammaproteobacteria bacterium]
MTSFECGDVILVPFPFTDQSNRKQRPAVIVSTSAYNTERLALIIMAVTSQIRTENSLDCLVSDWQAAGLLKPSAVKPVIATIEQGLVIKHLGQHTETNRHAVSAALREMLCRSTVAP